MPEHQPERELTPRQIVAELDRDIVGQAEAKRAVAIALRNRWRRRQLSEELRQQVTPKNIMLIGPDRRRQDRDRPPAGDPGRRAVREGRGDQVHRGRLRRPRRRGPDPRPGRGRDRPGQERRASQGRRAGQRASRAAAARPALAAAAGDHLARCRNAAGRRGRRAPAAVAREDEGAAATPASSRTAKSRSPSPAGRSPRSRSSARATSNRWRWISRTCSRRSCPSSRKPAG